MQNKLKNKLRMKNDSLKVNQNSDGSYTFEWDKSDPSWSFLNNLTTKEIQSIIENSIKEDSNVWLQKLFFKSFTRFC